jgi:hypothetical protein
MAGSSLCCAAARALIIAFSTKLRPVSSTSGTLNSDWERRSTPRGASIRPSSLSLPAFPLARTTVCFPFIS